MLKLSRMSAAPVSKKGVDAMLKALREDPPSNSKALVEAYRGVIAACKLPDDEYPYLYANYAIINPSHAMEGDISLKAAKECWKILEPTMKSGSHFHFTDMGQFYEEATRVSTNCIAWNEGLRTSDPAVLEKCLEVVNVGCQFARPGDTYIVDTKVRLLLHMGRKEEAYAVVFHDRGNHELSDVRQDEDYKAWAKDYAERNPVIFTEEEKSFLRAAEVVHKHMLTLLPDRATRAGESDVDGSAFLASKIEMLPEDEDHPLIELSEIGSDTFAIVRGNVHVPGSVLADKLESALGDCNSNSLIIEGDLVIDGGYMDSTIELIVGGNFTCDDCTSCDGVILVKGDAEMTYGCLGLGNDGFIRVLGNVRAPYMVMDDHAFQCTPADSTKALSVQAHNTVYVADVGNYKCPPYLFNPDALDVDEETVDMYKFMDLVTAHKNPFVTLPPPDAATTEAEDEKQVHPEAKKPRVDI